MSFFAPQAYTKETLSKAFEWLQHQPTSVRQAAANPDMLVSIYLQAQRQGLQRIDADAPVSSRKFIDDLKTLSRDFAQFDEAPQPQHMQVIPQATVRPQNMPAAATQQHSQHNMTQSTQHTIAQTTQHTIAQSSTQHTVGSLQMPQQVTFTSELPMAPLSSREIPEGYFLLDSKSLEIIHRLQERFNLSSPQEALRMLLAVGAEHISRWD